jgi:hypothetical protein
LAAAKPAPKNRLILEWPLRFNKYRAGLNDRTLVVGSLPFEGSIYFGVQAPAFSASFCLDINQNWQLLLYPCNQISIII